MTSRYEAFAFPTTFAVPSTMRALVASGRGMENLAVATVPVPEPGPNQLLARVDAAGVCTSNLKLIAQGADHTYLNGWDLARWPIILGDEGSITLMRVGRNLAGRFKPGERYGVQPAVDVAPILHRERYRDQAAGMAKCAVGYTLPGHLAEYVLIQEEVLAAQCLLPLPSAGLPYFAVSIGEPISCVLSAQERHFHFHKDGPLGGRRVEKGLLPGGVTVVRGAGVMGRMHAELALRARPRVLIVVASRVERLRRVENDIGPRASAAGVRLMCVQPADLDAALRVASGGKGADDLILAVGVRDEQQRALGRLAQGGVANLFGGLPRGEHLLELDSLAVHYREIHVVGSSGGEPSDLANALGAIADGSIDAGSYVAAVGGLEDAVDVLKSVKDARLEGRAILYPHVRRLPVRAVDRWSGDDEKSFLEENLRPA